MERPDVSVAVDGSLYRFHPHFHDLMVEKIEQLVKPEIKVRIRHLIKVMITAASYLVGYDIELTKHFVMWFCHSCDILPSV